MKDQCKQAVAKALGKEKLNQQEALDIDERVIDAKKAIARKDMNRTGFVGDFLFKLGHLT